MTSERGTYDDPGVDAIVATREDDLIGTGLDDTAPGPVGTDTGAPSGASGTTSGSAGSGSGDRLQEAAGGVAERVADTAQRTVGTQVEGQLGRAGDTLEQLASAVRRAGEEIRDEQPQIAGFADMAANQVERASTHLRGTDFQGLVGELESFARRQPAVFLGSALALGLVASRFLKATPGSGSSAGRSGNDRSAGYAGGYGSSYGSRFTGGYGAGYGTGMGTAGLGAPAASRTGSATSPLATGTSATGVEHGGA
jgi:hypothetical protein